MSDTKEERVLNNSTVNGAKKNTSDLEVYGDGDGTVIARELV